MRRFRGVSIALLLTGAASPALAQDRSSDNAVTQAEDAFGFSVGRESLGIYNAGNARGFSPSAAGNVRIDGLYFSSSYDLNSIVLDSTSIKVGLSAQGYPFAAPSGIVDLSLRRPQGNGASIVVNGDSYSSAGIEIDGSLTLNEHLAIGYGVTAGRVAFPDGTANINHGQGLIARWRPAPGVEIVPFWTLNNDYDDEAGPFLIPGGAYLPPIPPEHRFDGPKWVDFRYTATNHGVVASYAASKTWLLRLGAFRSVFDQKTGYANLLVDIQPDGTAERIVEADPRLKNESLSGEMRVTHSLTDGPRLHVIHLSIRERNTRRQFGGSGVVDLGPARIGTTEEAPRPAFTFGPLSRDHVQQTTVGLAYDGRWKGVGEIGFGISRADYRKGVSLPGIPTVVSRARPWLYNATAAANLSAKLTIYAGYARGLEESGIAPAGATNRNQPLPAIITEQKDAGIRIVLAPGLKAVAGVFDLRRPYFSFDGGGTFTQVGTIRSQGAEFSVSGKLTSRLDLVGGGVFLRPRVVRSASAIGAIGDRPVGLSSHLLIANLNWRVPGLNGLSLDVATVHRGATPATTDNLVILPPRARVDIGGRYRFKLAKHDATFRLQMSNVFDQIGFGIAGSGVYTGISGRYLTGYLAVDV